MCKKSTFAPCVAGFVGLTNYWSPIGNRNLSPATYRLHTDFIRQRPPLRDLLKLTRYDRLMSERSAYCDGFKAALAAAEAGIERRELRAFLNTKLREWQVRGAEIGREPAPKIDARADDALALGDFVAASRRRKR